MTVGCFLSRYGTVATGKSVPPNEIEMPTWSKAYLCFYRALSGGRSIRQFGHALKNTRDEFDGFFENGRIGWRTEGLERESRAHAREMQARFRACINLSRPQHGNSSPAHYSADWDRVQLDDLADGAPILNSHLGRISVSRTEGDGGSCYLAAQNAIST